MIVGDPPVVVGFEGVGEIEELGPGVTGSPSANGFAPAFPQSAPIVRSAFTRLTI